MLPAVKSSGRLSPFLVGCHCCVISGRVTARDGRPPYVLLPDAADVTWSLSVCWQVRLVDIDLNNMIPL
ncbi:hypothetical protein COCSUDRAFT_34401 [Coccomyxa subellipsoidea C-169]|uniref:Uncharacterized protein n=1 Tax=Coccomyxa subellipsoidea (strain C-169) TaxID=574566 RepID=I0YKB7_COCSC|nr:hypothetical protein COCSUDRAFT_34401 [Coccomyxa subellipsoidea C-169]EIE18836.1 hypothetical protein COCSUDRAFT_34401 [Coccomyxa subellipsoidea C-169]|eukprot:XP_005643380.1 hypothetical protein COCSUDRAFT_34401 [Coccomyxa subellipsoidea C-169]